MIVLLPCYSLESLSLQRDSSEVDELLSAWSALYHPALLEMTRKLPGWDNASAPSEEASVQETPVRCVVVPPCCESARLKAWCEKKRESGTFVIRGTPQRGDIVATVLEHLGATAHGFDDDFVADCLAFGTAHFWTEVVTRQMRYMSMLDESQLTTKLLDAVAAARDENPGEARAHLREAFEMLSRSKEYFYPGTTYLVGLTLTASSVLGRPLRNELSSVGFTNLYLPAALLREIHEREPQTLLLLRKALHPNASPEFLLHLEHASHRAFQETVPPEATSGGSPEAVRPTGPDTSALPAERPGAVILIGDDLDEAPLPMLPLPEIADRIVRGLRVYVRRLGCRPDFYGRMNKGFTPVLPQLLKLAGYKGAIHFAPRDGWTVPGEHQSRISWLGTDKTKIEALQKFPLDAASHETFFALPHKMGYSNSSDQSATYVLAHYPGKKSPWMDDLLRASRYSSVLGRLSRLDEYFEDTKFSGVTKSFGCGTYRMNVLLQSVREHRECPVSHWSDYYRLLAERAALRTLLALRTAIDRDRASFESYRDKLEGFYGPVLEGIEARLFGDATEETQEDVQTETKTERETSCSDATEKPKSRFVAVGTLPKPDYHHTFISTEKKRREIEQLFLDEAAFAIHGKPIGEIEKLSDSQIEKIVGVLLVNPLSFTRTMYVDLSELVKLPKAEGNVKLAGESSFDGNLRKEAVVEVPPLGFLWIGPKDATEHGRDDFSGRDFDTKKRAGASSEIAHRGGTTVVNTLFGTVKSFFSGKKAMLRKEPALVECVTEKVERRGRSVQVKRFHILRNDYFEARIDATTGEMASLKTFNLRENRFAHHLAFRLPGEDRGKDSRSEHSPAFGYTISCADRFEVLANGPITGRLRVHGRLMRPDGTLAAKFIETFTIRRLSRILELEIELEPFLEPGSQPWDSYYGARFAWGDSFAEVRSGVNGGAYPQESELLHAPEYVDIREENDSITILCGGLPYHRVYEGGRMDTIVIPQGETARRFRLGIGVDLPHPHLDAQEFLLGDFTATGMIPAPKSHAAWLFSTGAKNIVVTQIEPLFGTRTFSRSPQERSVRPENVAFSGEAASDTAERTETLTGFRIMLLETENKDSRVSFRSFLPLQKALKTDLLRNVEEEIAIEDDRVKLAMHARELLPLEIHLDVRR